MTRYTIDPDALARLRLLKSEVAQIEADISADIVRQAGFTIGDLVEDKLTGYQYRIKGASGYEHEGYGNIIIRGNRVWKQGRKAGREASSDSWLRTSDLVIIEKAKGTEIATN